MQEDNYTYIEELIERFFEGETSNNEEEELYSFFSKQDIPEHLKKYQQVFYYFNETIEEELEYSNKKEIITYKETPKITRWLPLMGIVATILLFFIFPFVVEKDSIEKDIQGYIIQNGEKNTDIELIAAELELVAFSAEQKSKNMKKRVSELFEREKLNPMKFVHIQEKDYKSVINKLFTEETREDVIKILENQN